MLLRVSSELQGHNVDLAAITDPKAAGASGIPQAGVLVAFADAVVGRDDGELDRAREAVLDDLGAVGLVDAAAVASNFERMVRIADGCGIPLDDTVAMVSADMREDLGIDDFHGAQQTREIRGIRRVAGRVMSRMLPVVLKIFQDRD